MNKVLVACAIVLSAVTRLGKRNRRRRHHGHLYTVSIRFDDRYHLHHAVFTVARYQRVSARPWRPNSIKKIVPSAPPGRRWTG
jgi:hypothetical protein